MGQTADAPVWLNAERLSPYEFWQFWRNTEDDDVAQFPASLYRAAARRGAASRQPPGIGDQRGEAGSRH
jgi:hypothetical protein